MGANTRGFANLLNTDGTFLSGAINNTSVSGITDLPTAVKSDLVPIIGYGLGNDAAMEHYDGGRSGVAVFDGTYDAYCFTFTNVRPATDNVQFEWNASTDTGSNYNVTKTTTVFDAGNNESDSNTFGYDTGADLAQSSSYCRIARNVSSDTDHGVCGELWIFNVASTTYVKHFYSVVSANDRNNYEYKTFVQGYLNTTTAVDAVAFRFASGNLSTGSIRVYGLK
jgi:hypothetical protein